MGKDHANYKPNVAQHNFTEQQLVTCTQQELRKNINIKKKSHLEQYKLRSLQKIVSQETHFRDLRQLFVKHW